MRKFQKKFFVLVALMCAAVLVLQACKPSEPAVTLTLSKASITLDVGATETLTATASNGDTVTWLSSDDTIATVDGGVVTAVKHGTATIKAAAAGKEELCTVTVREPAVTFSRSTLSLLAGGTGTGASAGTYELEAEKVNTVHPIVWSSENTSVATVTAHATKANTATITALKNGTSVIKAKAGDAEATLTLTVGRRTASLNLNETIYQLVKGVEEEVQLTATPTGADAGDVVTWLSSNPEFATVSASGLVEYVAAGSTTITATLAQTDTHSAATATCAITTVERGIQLNHYTTEIVAGETQTLTATPNFTPVGDIEWSIENDTDGTDIASDIIEVNSQTGEITALAIGTAYVVAAVDGIEAKCLVTVSAVLLTLNKTELELVYGTSSMLKLTTNSGANIVWSQSGTSLELAQDGGNECRVTAKPSNSDSTTEVNTVTATITIGTTEYTATCDVTRAQASIEFFAGTDSSKTFNVRTANAGLLVNSPNLIRNGTDGTFLSTYIAAIYTYDYFYNAQGERTENPFDTTNLSANSNAFALIVDANGKVANIYAPANVNNANFALVYGYNASSEPSVLCKGTTNGDQNTFIHNENYQGGNYTIPKLIKEGGYAIVCPNGDPNVAIGLRYWADGKLWRDETMTKAVLGTRVNLINVDLSDNGIDQKLMTLNKYTATITGKGNTQTLTANVYHHDAKTVTWVSSNPDIATVDSATGVVTAVSAGTCNITATNSDSLFTETCAVTVEYIQPALSIDKTTHTLTYDANNDTGESFDLTITITNFADYFSGLSDMLGSTPSLTVTTEADFVAIGEVTVEDSVFKCTITATEVNAEAAVIDVVLSYGSSQQKIASCSVTVKGLDPELEIKVGDEDANGESFDLAGLDDLQLSVTKYNTEKTINYTSDNTAAATVDASGKITALKDGNGTAVITVWAGDTIETADVSETVTVNVSPLVFSINRTSLVLAYNAKDQLLITKNSARAITWSSSDSTIVSVTSAGIIQTAPSSTAGALSATITATLTGTDETATCEVNRATAGIEFFAGTADLKTYNIRSTGYSIAINGTGYDNGYIRYGSDTTKTCDIAIYTYNYFYSGAGRTEPTGNATNFWKKLTGLQGTGAEPVASAYNAFAFVVNAEGKVTYLYAPVGGIYYLDNEGVVKNAAGSNNDYLHSGTYPINSIISEGDYVVISVNGPTNNLRTWADSNTASGGKLFRNIEKQLVGNYVNLVNIDLTGYGAASNYQNAKLDNYTLAGTEEGEELELEITVRNAVAGDKITLETSDNLVAIIVDEEGEPLTELTIAPEDIDTDGAYIVTIKVRIVLDTGTGTCDIIATVGTFVTKCAVSVTIAEPAI